RTRVPASARTATRSGCWARPTARARAMSSAPRSGVASACARGLDQSPGRPRRTGRNGVRAGGLRPRARAWSRSSSVSPGCTWSEAQRAVEAGGDVLVVGVHLVDHGGVVVPVDAVGVVAGVVDPGALALAVVLL